MAWNVRDLYRPRRTFRRRPLRRTELNLEILEQRLAPANVTEFDYGNTGGTTGVNSNETALTPATVNTSNFGKLSTTNLDGQVYAEPLVMQGVVIGAAGGDSGVNIVGGASGSHGVVFVCTEHDSIYAIDTAPGSGAVLWQRSFTNINAGYVGTTTGTNINNTLTATAISTVPNGDTGSSDINPEIGITGTPVIDTANGMLYVLVKTKETINGVANYVQRLHGINLSDGTDKVQPYLLGQTNNGNTNNTPIFVYGSGSGAVTDPNRTTDGNPGTQIVQFNALREAVRQGMRLVNGKVYATYASHGDNGPYHGWVIEWTVSSSGFTPAGWFCTSPNNGLAGIWGGGGALQFEPDGSAFYFETGNGSGGAPTLDANGFPTNYNYNEAVVKVVPDTTSVNAQGHNGWGMKAADYFIPNNVASLDGADSDFGSGSPLLLPASAGIPGHPNLLVAAGKSGVIYLIDRNTGMMGHYSTVDHVVYETGNNAVVGSLSEPAYFNGHLYWTSGYSGPAIEYSISSTGVITAVSQTSATFNYLPGSIQISASGTNNGIAWVVDRNNPNAIHAYNANTLSTELWNSTMAAAGKDQPGTLIKMNVPTIANGEVFLGTTNSLVIYGPNLPPNGVPNAPVLSATPLSGSSVNLTWTDTTQPPNTATGYSIEDSTDGSSFTVVTTTPSGSTSVALGGLQPLTKYWFRIRGFNTFGGTGYSPYSNTATATTTNLTPLIDFSNGFSNAAGSMTLNGAAKLSGSNLEVTDGNSLETSSAFYNTRVDITQFDTTFNFQITPAASFIGEGFTFVIQNAGTSSLGTNQGGLGYGAQSTGGSGGIPLSVAIKFDTNSNQGEGNDSTGLYTGGAAPTNVGSNDMSSTGINLHSGHVFQATLAYDGTTLTEQIVDTVTNAKVTYTYTINIPNTIGASSAFVGFTGSTGNPVSTQNIQNWTFNPFASVSPNAPSGLGAIVASASSVNLTWTTNSTNQTGFHLDRATDSAFTQNLITESIPAAASSFTDTATGLSPGNTYYYRLRSYNGAGDSGNSNSVNVTIPLAPPKPTLQQVTGVSTTEIDMSWQDNAGHQADNYVILRAVNHGTFTQVASLPPTSRTAPSEYDWSDTGLTPGFFYEYHIEAVNVSGNNDFAGLNATTITQPASGLSATGGNGVVNLSWTAPTGAVSYNIYRGSSSGGETLLTNVTTTTYSDTSVSNGQGYYYDVTALNGNLAPIPAESAASNEVVAAPGKLPAGTANFAYNQTITESWGSGNKTLTVSNVSGAISGLTVPNSGTNTLTISGTPTAAGTETFKLTAVDSTGATAVTNYSLTVNPAVALAPSSLPADTVNVPYGQTVTATGGTGSLTLTVSNLSGSIPGLTIPASGTTSLAITGTPSAAGTVTFKVTATDSIGASAFRNYSITVNPVLSLAPSSLPVDTAAVPYNQTITVSGGTPNVVLSVTNVSGTVTGLTITVNNNNGTVNVNGTPSAGTESFTVNATDGVGATTSNNYTITVNPVIALSPSSLPAGPVNVPYNQTVTASGGTGNKSLTVNNISGSIAGLTIPTNGTNTLTFSGTPTGTGTVTFTVTATDQVNASVSTTYAISINPPSAFLSMPSAGYSGATNTTLMNYPISISQLQDVASIPHVGLATASVTLNYPTGVFNFPIGSNQATADVSLGTVPLSDPATPGGAANWTLAANSPQDGVLSISLSAAPGKSFPVSTRSPTLAANGSIVASVNVSNGGNNYTTAPTVTFAAAPAGGTTATGTATISGGHVTAITIINPGSGYTSAPNISFSGGGGTGAAATSTLGSGTLTVGTTYYYVVTAVVNSQEIPPSGEVTMTPTTGNQAVVVNWTSFPGATGYKIYRTTTNNSFGSSSLVTTIASGATATFTDSGAATTTGAPPNFGAGGTLVNVSLPIRAGAPLGNVTLTVVNNSSGHTQIAGTNGNYTLSPAPPYTGTVTITQGIQNPPTVAASQTFITESNIVLTQGAPGVLTGASDPQGETFTVGTVNGSAASVGVPVTLASGATVTVQANGSFVFTPANNFIGTDSFTFQSIDAGNSLSNTGTVNISVIPTLQLVPLGTSSGNPGQTITEQVVLDNPNPSGGVGPLAGYNLVVTYNPSVLATASDGSQVALGSAIPNDWTFTPNAQTPGVIAIGAFGSGVSSDLVSGPAPLVLATIQFTIQSVPSQTTQVELVPTAALSSGTASTLITGSNSGIYLLRPALPGSLATLILTNGGSGYTTPPTINFAGGGGSGAAATAVLQNNGADAGGDPVIGLVITNQGGGYTSAPTLSFKTSNAPGSGAAATATMSPFAPGAFMPGVDTTVTVTTVTITISPSTLPSGTVNAAYSQTLTASGGTGPYHFALASGTLPPGLTLSTSGVLSGTPTSASGSPYSFTISATDANSNAGTQSYTVTIFYPANVLTITAPSSATAGTPFNVTVTATDGSGHTAGGFNGTVTLTSTAGADISPTSIMLSGGTATFPLTLTTAGAQTVTASAGGLTSGAAVVTVAQGPFSEYVVTTPAGTSFSAGANFLLYVQAADQYGNAVTSYSGPSTVTASINPTSTASSFPTTVSLNSTGFGIALANLQKVGTYTITAASGSFTGSSSPVTVTAGPAVKLGFGTQPANTPTGVVMPTVTVQVQDIFGNLVSTDNSDTVTLGIASGPGGFLASTTTSATVHNGVATFTNLTLVKPGTYTLSELVPTLYTGPNSNTFTIAPLQVVPGSFVGTPSGFSLQFNAPYLVNSTTPILYGQDVGATPPVPTVTVTGPGGPVAGTLVLNQATNSITYVATDTTLFVNNKSPVLPDGVYTVNITSGAATNGFQALNSGGGLLDGKGTGLPGSGDYTVSFTVGAAAAGDDIVWVPPTADGPGQVLQGPGTNQNGSGLPIYLTDTRGTVTNVLLTLNYDPTLLTVTEVTGNNFIDLLPSSTPGHAVIQYSGPALMKGTDPIGYVTASVPSGTVGNPVPYKAKDLLTLSNVSVNTGTIPVATANAVHLVAYVGDGDGNGAYSSNDAVQITRVVLQTDSGFAAYPLVDPVVVADTDGSGFIPADAALQANEAGVGFPTANLAVPPIPPGVVFQPISNNVDPSVAIPADLHLGTDGTVTVPVNVDDAHPAGSTGVIAGHLALTYDPNVFTVSAADVHPGSLLASGSWSIVPTIDQATGQIAIALSSATPVTSTLAGSLVTIDFHLVGQSSSLSPIHLAPSVSLSGQPVATELQDAQGRFTLTFPMTETVVSLGSYTAPHVAAVQAAVNVATNSAAVVETPEESGQVSPVIEIATATVAAAAEASDQGLTNLPVAAAASEPVHTAIAAGHGPTAVVASALPLTTLVPLTALVFQFGTMAGASGSNPGSGQHWSDPLFQALGRTAPFDFSLSGAAQVLERALAGQLFLSQPVSDPFGDGNWEEAGSTMDWQGLAIQPASRTTADRSGTERGAAPSTLDTANHRDALDQAFAQSLDDTDVGEDE
jgi:fibronectin type 3 domain-containing protein